MIIYLRETIYLRISDFKSIKRINGITSISLKTGDSILWIIECKTLVKQILVDNANLRKNCILDNVIHVIPGNLLDSHHSTLRSLFIYNINILHAT